MDTQTLKTRGIKASKLYLQGYGCEVLEDKVDGAVDLIVRDADDLVFIKVSTKSFGAGFGADAVDKKTREVFENTAMNYLFTHDLPTSRIRFDVLALLISDDGKAFLRHHRDAFGVAA